MAISRRVSYEQLEVLWDFLNTHRDIALGFNKSAQAREMSKRMWTNVSQNLNSMVGGAVKDAKGWAAYWVDYKGKIKKKCAAIRASESRTGGGPGPKVTLTDIEKKYLSILGENYGTGLPGIQVDPFDTQAHGSQESQTQLDNLHAPIFEPTIETIISQHSPVMITSDTETTTQQITIAEIVQPTPRVRSRQRRRILPMSQTEARRALVESSHKRAGATEKINQTLGNIENVLSRMVVILESIENRLVLK